MSNSITKVAILAHACEYNAGCLFVVSGAPGVGKSSLLKKAHEVALRAGHSVELLLASEFLSSVKSLEEYVDTDVLLIDDFASLLGSKSNQGFLDGWLLDRSKKRKTTVVVLDDGFDLKDEVISIRLDSGHRLTIDRFESDSEWWL